MCKSIAAPVQNILEIYHLYITILHSNLCKSMLGIELLAEDQGALVSLKTSAHYYFLKQIPKRILKKKKCIAMNDHIMLINMLSQVQIIFYSSIDASP